MFISYMSLLTEIISSLYIYHLRASTVASRCTVVKCNHVDKASNRNLLQMNKKLHNLVLMIKAFLYWVVVSVKVK